MRRSRLARESIRRFATGAWMLLALLLAGSHAAAQQTILQRDSKRECATCHVDWVDSFERKSPMLLMDIPATGLAAVEDTCLDCHDGSVGDSRRNVWLEHGHRRNEKPSDKIKVPANMPLEDGKLVCRTCHTAHTVPGANDISKIVFLRAANEGGLCQQCHVDRAYGQEHGSHPLAKLPFELPKEIRDAHGRTDIADRTKMACQTCHSTHGPTREHLLVMGAESGQLCQTCHEKLRPMEWKVDAPREHPQNPPVKTDGQRLAIKQMGTRLGPNDTLTCFSCHKMHDNRGNKFMLADTLSESRICIRCHEERKIVLGSKHDLRTTRPEDKNKLNMTPEEAGPCGSCHSFHRYARETRPGLGDPIGRCVTCHQPKGPGVDKPLGFAHPPSVPASKIPAGSNLKLLPCNEDPAKKSLACSTCHDPHDASKTLFLKYDKNKLCSTCHVERFGQMAGEHDFTKKPQLKNARGWTAEQSGKCGFCHAVHGESDLLLWVGTKEKPKTPDDLCMQCHRDGGLASKKMAAAYSHPTGPKARPATRPAQALPLFNEHALMDKNGFVSCASCHDPHTDSTKQKEMLRVSGTTSNLCLQCHAEKSQMVGGVHDPAGKTNWPVPEKKGDLCMSCHVPHSSDPERQRWAFVPAKGVNMHDAACVKCHEKNGWADAGSETASPGKAMHPTALPARGHAGALGSGLPLVGATFDGPRDTIACRTCHDPHLASSDAKLTRVGRGEAPEALCGKCHAETHNMSKGMHARDALAAKAASIAPGMPGAFKLGDKPQACAPCHANHAVEGSKKKLLWAGPTGMLGQNETEKRCLSCHDPATARRGVTILMRHPEEPFKAMATPDNSGPTISQITCATCHTPHGGSDGPIVKNLDERRLSRPMVLESTVKQCAKCHGPDSSRMMLYWHTPAKRDQIERFIRGGR